MDLVTGQRTFYVGVSGVTDGAITEIPFRDSASNDIKCNYIQVVLALDSDQAQDLGGFVAELSGVPHEGDMITNTLSALNATSPPASGICGFGGFAARGSTSDAIEWHGSNGQVATGIKIQTALTQSNTSNTASYAITYGNLYPLNTRRLEQSYDAGE